MCACQYKVRRGVIEGYAIAVDAIVTAQAVDPKIGSMLLRLLARDSCMTVITYLLVHRDWVGRMAVRTAHVFVANIDIV